MIIDKNIKMGGKLKGGGRTYKSRYQRNKKMK